MDNKKIIKCGIYGIINEVEKKVYIGKSKDIDSRWKEHRRDLSQGKHHNKPLQKSWNSHGEDAFKWKVIELVPENIYGLVELEYIEKYHKKGKAYNVYGLKDELRYRLSQALMDEELYFEKVEIDHKSDDCISTKGKPLQFAVYGINVEEEVFIHIYSVDFDTTAEKEIDNNTRYLYCNKYNRHYYEIPYSMNEPMDIDAVIENTVKTIKRDVGC